MLRSNLRARNQFFNRIKGTYTEHNCRSEESLRRAFLQWKTSRLELSNDTSPNELRYYLHKCLDVLWRIIFDFASVPSIDDLSQFKLKMQSTEDICVDIMGNACNICWDLGADADKWSRSNCNNMFQHGGNIQTNHWNSNSNTAWFINGYFRCAAKRSCCQASGSWSHQWWWQFSP